MQILFRVTLWLLGDSGVKKESRRSSGPRCPPHDPAWLLLLLLLTMHHSSSLTRLDGWEWKKALFKGCAWSTALFSGMNVWRRVRSVSSPKRVASQERPWVLLGSGNYVFEALSFQAIAGISTATCGVLTWKNVDRRRTNSELEEDWCKVGWRVRKNGVKWRSMKQNGSA